jgi:hypothetical protein
MFDIETEYKIFNEIVSPGVVSEVRSISKLADRIKKVFDTIDAKGKYASQKMNFGGSQAYGARSNDYYPTPQEVTPAEALLRVKRMEMFSLGFEGLSLELAKSQGSPIDPVAFEQQEMIKGLGDDMSRQLMGDGSGKIVDCNGLGSGTPTLVVDSPYYTKPAPLFFKPKRVIDIWTPGGSIKVTAKSIVSIDSDTQVTLSANGTWADDDAVYAESAYTAAEAVGKGEIMGILGIVRDTNPPAPNASAGLQGLSVANYAEWAAKVWANGGVARAFDEDLLVKALLYHERYGTKITVMLITQGIFRLWKQHLEAFKVLGPGKNTMWGGWDALPFYYAGKEIPMVADLFSPDGNIVALAESEFTLHLTNKSWITWESGYGGDGRILQKVAGRNAYVAEGHIFGNLGVRSRAGSGFRITDIEEPD